MQLIGNAFVALLRQRTSSGRKVSAMEYDIFSGHDDGNAIWVDAVDGLAAAADRMNQLAREKPGPYFVLCTTKYKILTSIDTCTAEENAQEAITWTQQATDEDEA